jgi:AraC family transcriptional regulator
VDVAMMGETLADTLRRLRLHRAALKLTASAVPVAAIAREAGYTSAQAFIRAFREGYGVTPARFRLHGETSLAMQRVTNETKGEHPMFKTGEVKIQNLAPMRVAALRHHGDYQQIGASFGALMVWAAGKNIAKMEARTFGIYYDDPMSKPKDQLISEACVELPRDFELQTANTNEPRAINLSSGKHAVFIFTGPYSELEKPYRWLFDTWLAHSGEQLRDAPTFEEYLNDARNTPPAELKTAICIPLI